jgi:hypothetical protein
VYASPGVIVGGEDMMADTKATEVETNFAVFQKMLPTLLPARAGKFALMHDGQIVNFFDTMADAARFGVAQFGDMYSVQEVTNRNVSLGYYSYAMHDLHS